MTSKGTPWNHLINKPLKNLFIHDSSELYAFRQALSLTNTKLFQIQSDGPPILGSCFQPLLICIGNLKRVLKIQEITLLVSFYISPSTHLHELQGKTMNFTNKLFQT